MNKITTKGWYSNVKITYEFDKDSNIYWATTVVRKILKDLWYHDDTIDKVMKRFDGDDGFILSC